MTDFTARRTAMVDTQVRPSDVTKFPIIDAMLSVPREEFVPATLKEAAYAGEPLPLGDGRMLMDPRLQAKMLDALAIGPGDLVLDVAPGLGYSAALISRLAEAVVALEEDDTMAREATEALETTGADNVVVEQGPLAEGAAEHAPFDVIVIEGGVNEIPDALVEQLKEGGRIAAVVMQGAVGEMRIGVKTQGRLQWRAMFNASAPVLPGFATTPIFTL